MKMLSQLGTDRVSDQLLELLEWLFATKKFHKTWCGEYCIPEERFVCWRWNISVSLVYLPCKRNYSFTEPRSGVPPIQRLIFSIRPISSSGELGGPGNWLNRAERIRSRHDVWKSKTLSLMSCVCLGSRERQVFWWMELERRWNMKWYSDTQTFFAVGSVAFVISCQRDISDLDFKNYFVSF